MKNPLSAKGEERVVQQSADEVSNHHRIFLMPANISAA
ncbi:MAG: hypothetical protein JWQ79_3631 [Mucilaginibacter sp.]|nr:hypothetical protein [Mucilaginibacter sp.]